MREDWAGIFLKIIRRQHVVVCRDESFEKSPGAPRNLAHGLTIRA